MHSNASTSPSVPLSCSPGLSPPSGVTAALPAPAAHPTSATVSPRQGVCALAGCILPLDWDKPSDTPGPAELSRRCRGGVGGVREVWKVQRGCAGAVPQVQEACGRCPRDLRRCERCGAGAGAVLALSPQVREVREDTGELRERCRGGWRGRAAAGAGLFIVRENHKRLKRREKV